MCVTMTTTPTHPPLLRVGGLDCGDEAARWLTNVLDRDCRLVKQNPAVARTSQRSINDFNERGSPLSLANEAQYLLISDNSVEHLGTAVRTRGGPELNDLCTRFRPNLVVGCGPVARGNSGYLEPYAEEAWKSLTIGCTSFRVR